MRWRSSGKLQAIKSVFKTRRENSEANDSTPVRVREELGVMRAAHEHPFIVTPRVVFFMSLQLP